MEETDWEERMRAITHLLASPPSELGKSPLHSQVFLAAAAPCYRRWDFPPFLCRGPGGPTLLSWSLNFFFSKLRRGGRPYAVSWRSNCPFQQPPPRVLSRAVDPPPDNPSPASLRAYFHRRLRRRRPGFEVPGPIVVLLPNFLLFSLLLWDPLSLRQDDL